MLDERPGAHLGHGGTVKGNDIVCPFHDWRWTGEGVCKEIPYARKIPAAARMSAYEVRDLNGFIFVWVHAENLRPTWEIQPIPEIGAAENLQTHIGIATGLVVVGDLIGAGASEERGVVGETLNLAARLEALAGRACGRGLHQRGLSLRV